MLDQVVKWYIAICDQSRLFWKLCVKWIEAGPDLRNEVETYHFAMQEATQFRLQKRGGNKNKQHCGEIFSEIGPK